MTDTHRHAGIRTPSARMSPDNVGTAVDSTDALSALSDEHAREIIAVLDDGPLPAREIHERLDVSRATVYRRLDRLESAGLVESEMGIHPEGHHRERYSLALDSLRVTFGHDGPTATAA